jgi:Rrf2 family iron-sulfur cluster assembly transcriptional regulator
MKLTTRGRYAVTAMLDLALHAQAGPVSLSDVAVRQAISLSYLEQLFAKLKRAALVVSSRGPGGGYLPARPLDEVSVADIVDAVDERIDATRCGGHGNCQDGETCLTHQLWAELSHRIHDYLQSVSLASLVDRQQLAVLAQRADARLGDEARLIDTLSL